MNVMEDSRRKQTAPTLNPTPPKSFCPSAPLILQVPPPFLTGPDILSTSITVPIQRQPTVEQRQITDSRGRIRFRNETDKLQQNDKKTVGDSIGPHTNRKKEEATDYLLGTPPPPMRKELCATEGSVRP